MVLHVCSIRIGSIAITASHEVWLRTIRTSARTCLMDSSGWKAQGAKPYAVNVNAGGKVRRLISLSMGCSCENRALRSWRMGSAATKAMFYKRANARELCRECVREANARPMGVELEGDPIDDSE